MYPTIDDDAALFVYVMRFSNHSAAVAYVSTKKWWNTGLKCLLHICLYTCSLLLDGAWSSSSRHSIDSLSCGR